MVRVTDWPGAARRGIYHVDLSTAPDKGDNVISRPGVQESKTSHAPESKANASISELRTMGVLGKGNRTDFDQGIYESDTEQILLVEKKNQIRVVTPLSCGASLPECSSEVKLGPVDVRNLGANTTFFLGSLTSDAIPQSHRLLLIVSTNALNTGMSFEDDKKLKLVSLGTTPVLMQVAKVQFTLKHLLAGKLKMWALSANGQRREEIPLTVSNGTVIGLINTALLANGPTPYFELQAPPL